MWFRAFALQVLTDLNIADVMIMRSILRIEKVNNGLKHLSLNKGVLAEPSIVSRS